MKGWPQDCRAWRLHLHTSALLVAHTRRVGTHYHFISCFRRGPGQMFKAADSAWKHCGLYPRDRGIPATRVVPDKNGTSPEIRS
jgi:hypothetical protein